jgi:hypothetical protein
MDITSRDVEGVLQRELSNIDIACLIAKLDSFSVFVGCSLCDDPSSVGLSLSRLRNIIISFIMTHDCSFGDIKPDLTFILNLSETIDKTIFNLDRIGLKDTTYGGNRIQYIQSEITEILPKVALIPISSFLSIC